MRIVTQSVKASNKTTHTGSEYHIHRDAQSLDEIYRAYVCSSFGAASAEHKSHRGSVFPYCIHLCPHLVDSEGVPDRVYGIQFKY